MVSFTELRKEEAASHREKFGDFGIAVTWEWAIRNDAQRVLYVGEGPVFNALSWLFQRAKQEVENNLSEPKEIIEATLSNKAIAGFYSQMYSHLLTLYEFMEPERNSSQVEWRIVNKIPTYHDTKNPDEIKKRLLSLAEDGINTLKVNVEDIYMLLCPYSRIRELRKALPIEFQDVNIVPYTKLSSIGVKLAASLSETRAFLRYFLRHMKSAVQNQPIKENTLILHSKSKDPWYQLPSVASMQSCAFYPDDVLNRASCDIQYESKDGAICDLRMPLIELLKLGQMIYSGVHDPQMNNLIKLALSEMKKRQSN